MRRGVPQSIPPIDFATLDLLPYGIIVVEEGGTIAYYNDREQEISGRRRQDVLGKNFFLEVAPCTQVRSFYGEFRELMGRREGVVRFQFRFPFPDRPREVEITLTPFEHEASIFCLIAVADLTEREYLRSHLMAGERFRSLGEVAAGVAHNFNNVLTVIQGYVHLLQEETLSASARGLLRTIAKAAGDGAAITGRIQSALRADAAAPSREGLDLSALAREVLQWTQAVLSTLTHGRAKQIVFEDRLGGPQRVHGDSGELREAILNLLKNAVDAIPTDGRIVLSDDGALPGEACLRIADTGIGMSDDTLSRLFQPLFTTKGTEGTGLGLVATYAVIQRHRGQIAVESVRGEGTTVIISLPLATDTSDT